MSLDFFLYENDEPVFHRNITHNLGGMAKMAGVYHWLWHPEKINVERAGELIVPLERGLKRLYKNENELQNHTPENGWGTYDDLINFTEEVLCGCCDFPTATIMAHR